MGIGERTTCVNIDLLSKAKKLYDLATSLVGNEDFYMICKSKPLSPNFTLSDMGTTQHDVIKVVARLKGGATAHRNPSNPVREFNGGVIAFENLATQNPS